MSLTFLIECFKNLNRWRFVIESAINRPFIARTLLEPFKHFPRMFYSFQQTSLHVLTFFRCQTSHTWCEARTLLHELKWRFWLFSWKRGWLRMKSRILRRSPSSLILTSGRWLAKEAWLDLRTHPKCQASWWKLPLRWTLRNERTNFSKLLNLPKLADIKERREFNFNLVNSGGVRLSFVHASVSFIWETFPARSSFDSEKRKKL